MEKFRILILGAKGNLGQALVKVFEKDNEVIPWDRGEVDITDKDLIIKKIKDLKPNVIINAAAYNAVDKCETDEKEFDLAKKINSEAPGYLAEGALEVGATLVHYSSDYVFDGKKRKGYKEDSEPKPISKYGETKLAGEKAVISFSGKGLKWYLIRTSKLFGPKGESEASKPSFFDVILFSSANKATKDKRELSVVNEEVSCFTFTLDLALATKKIIKGKFGCGVYHITNGGPCTWYEAALELFKIAGVKIKVEPVPASTFPRPAKRPKYSVLLNTKIEPMRDFREALKEYLKILK